MDKFAMCLAFHKGGGGEFLAKNSVLSYYRQAKKWLLGLFGSQKQAVNEKLLEKARTLGKYCMTREKGGMVEKAPACAKADLKLFMERFYSTAADALDYQDAALVCLIWHLFGRVPDLLLVYKQSLAASVNNVLFLRLIRVEMSEEKDLSLFPERAGFAACPLHAITVALLVQAVPCASLLSQLPAANAEADPSIMASILLIELLESAHGVDVGIGQDKTPVAATARAPDAHSYVDRVLEKTTKVAGVERELTSHSFRRGGAQHASGDTELSAQRISDRGAWNLTATNKAFAYVFNTTNEDQEIARVLRDWKGNEHVHVSELSIFDTQTQTKIAGVQSLMFSTCSNLRTPSFNVNQGVLDLCAAHLIRCYPHLKDLSPSAPAIKRLEECAIAAGCKTAELMLWSPELDKVKPVANSESTHNTPPDQQASEQCRAVIKYQAAVVSGLIELNQRWEQRMDAIEGELKKRRADIIPATEESKENEEACEIAPPSKKKKKKPPMTHLSAVRYEWYAREPCLWSLNVPR